MNFFIILSVLAWTIVVLALGWFAYRTDRMNQRITESYEEELNETNEYWHAKLEATDKAWEQGQQEIMDDLAASTLSFRETEGKLVAQIEELQADAVVMNAVMQALELDREEVREMAFQAQQKLHDHESNCLPKLRLV